MKHIGFDESLVLGELARIANDNGWVKTAETVTFEEEEVAPIEGGSKKFKAEMINSLEPLLVGSAMFGFLGGPSQKVKMRANALVAAIKQIPDTTPIDESVLHVGSLFQAMAKEDPEYKEFTERAFDSWLALSKKYGVKVLPGQNADDQDASDKNPLKTKMQELSSFYAQAVQKAGGDHGKASQIFDAQLQKVMQQLRGRFGNHPELKKFEQTAKTLKKADAKHDMSKSAKDEKCYDVTGETGEQLIETAHPGGGTKTELTHSKTDENLVETIVEQQQKDLEVVRKVPKGTYAALVDLYGKLEKMGHDKYLGELKNVINKIATPEDVIEHTMVSLADKLDKAGYVEAADKVDSMVKKKVTANPYFAKQFKQDFAQKLQGLDEKPGRMKEQMIGEWNSRSMPTLAEAFQAAADFESRWGKMWPNIPSLSQDTGRRYFSMYKDEQAELAVKQKQMQSGKAGDVSVEVGEPEFQHPPIEPSNKKLRMRKNWMRLFNNGLSKLTTEQVQANGLVPIKPRDAVFGGGTYAAAIKKVRDSKADTLKDFWRMMSTELMKEPEVVLPADEDEGVAGDVRQTPINIADKYIGQKFPRLSEKYAPEFYKAVRQKAVDYYNRSSKIYNEESAMQRLDEYMRTLLKNISADDVKKFINL